MIKTLVDLDSTQTLSNKTLAAPAVVGSYTGTHNYALNVWGNVGVKSGDDEAGYFFENSAHSVLASIRQDTNGNILTNLTTDTQTHYEYVEGSALGSAGVRFSSKHTGMEAYLPFTIDVGTVVGGTPDLFMVRKSGSTKFNIDNSGYMHVAVVATASVPVAAAAMNGAVLIEDTGAGCNLVAYKGGKRWKVALAEL